MFLDNNQKPESTKIPNNKRRVIDNFLRKIESIVQEGNQPKHELYQLDNIFEAKTKQRE